MRRKVWLVILLVGLLGLVAQASVTITTAIGNGADTFVGNDSNKGPNNNYGISTTMDVRISANSRAHIAYVKFDISQIAGDLTGAQFQMYITGGGATRTWNVYGLIDNDTDDAWGETAITYNTAPGMLPTDPQANGNYIIDTTKLTQIGTILVPSAINALVTSATASLNLDSFIASDTNSLLTLVFIATGGDRQFYVAAKEGLAANPTWSAPTLIFPNANERSASNPVPAYNAEVLPSLTTLSWTNTEPNNVSGIITCNVYLGTTEPNFTLPGYGLTQIASGTTATSATIPAGMLPLAETKYYWAVESFDSSTVPPALGTGPDWFFTVTSIPLVLTHPQAQTVTPGQTVQFSITADSYSTPHYTWYRSADNVNNTAADDTQVGTDSASLSFTAAGTDDGYYYCKVVNNSGEANAAYSNTASLIVQRQVAHWTLDQADFIGGQYLDVSGNGHHVDPNTATPSFVAGVIGGSDAVSMDPNSFASAGTWNPAYVSGQLTISAWINWRGENDSYQDVLSKMDAYADADMMWQFGVSQGGNVSLLADHGDNDDAILNGQPAIGSWEFIAVTFDGTTAIIYRALDGNINFTTASEAYAFGTDLQAAIGLGARADGTSIFNGTIDDIQVFNYAKDAFGIADLYNEMLSRDFCLSAYGSSQYDLDADNNCRIDMPDFAALAQVWLDCGLYPTCP